MNAKLAGIRKGCTLNDCIYTELREAFRKGTFETEADVAQFIDQRIKEAGAKNAFPTIIASGVNAVEWHHEPTKKKLKKGFCVIDFGSRFNGYCSDMTRTVFLGRTSKADRRIYSIVLRAQEKCIRKVKAGANGRKIYELAKERLGAYADYFGHGLGHGLSKLIHAKPRLNKKDALLKEGDVVTIEPGVYIPHVLGIRIEDDVLVKKNGYEVLSKSTKKLFEF